MDVVFYKKEGDTQMPIDHSEVLLITMLIALSVILITGYVAIKKWGREEDIEKKKS